MYAILIIKNLKPLYSLYQKKYQNVIGYIPCWIGVLFIRRNSPVSHYYNNLTCYLWSCSCSRVILESSDWRLNSNISPWHPTCAVRGSDTVMNILSTRLLLIPQRESSTSPSSQHPLPRHVLSLLAFSASYARLSTTPAVFVTSRQQSEDRAGSSTAVAAAVADPAVSRQRTHGGGGGGSRTIVWSRSTELDIVGVSKSRDISDFKILVDVSVIISESVCNELLA